MKVSELKEILNSVPDEMEVFVQTDEYSESVQSVSVKKVTYLDEPDTMGGSHKEDSLVIDIGYS